MNPRNILVAALVSLATPFGFANGQPIAIPESCSGPNAVMTPDQFQDAISELIKNRVIEYQLGSRRLMLKDPSALEQLRLSNHVVQICALATVVCW